MKKLTTMTTKAIAKTVTATAIAALLSVNAQTAPAITNTKHSTGEQNDRLKQGAATTSTVVGTIWRPGRLSCRRIERRLSSDQIKKAEEVDTMSDSLAAANNKIAELNRQLLASQNDQQGKIDQLNRQLLSSQRAQQDMEQLAFDSLTLPVLFKTGSDKLSARGRHHVQTLAEFLQKHTNYAVQLNGHADPRGTDEYNNVLSHYRAVAVKDALEIHGVCADRLQVTGFGANHSTALKGDLEAYAQERRVDIELIDSAVVMN